MSLPGAMNATCPETAASAPTLTSPVTSLWGVGSERAALLARLGIQTIGDLLLHRPHRYEDRRHFKPVRELVAGDSAVAYGRIVAAGVNRFRSGKTVFEFILDDGTARLHCRWWNLPFLERVFAMGDEVAVFGKVHSVRPRMMDHPETEKAELGDDAAVHLGRIVPIYPLTEGLTQRVLRGLTWRALEKFSELVAEPHPELDLSGLRIHPVADPATGQLALEETSLPSRREAVRSLHFPVELIEADRARQRLAFDEFLELQLTLTRRRRNLERNARPLPCPGDNRLIKPFLAALGFTLTDAQTKVLREIRADLTGQVPMRRLLQGDVGSGKTVTAACAALMVLESGLNVVVMAPTEILAEQLWRNFSAWLKPLGIPVEIRTGNRQGNTTPELSTIHHPPSAAATLTVGTHALIYDEAEIPRLGLVIIDEQHKFGVVQREQLLRRGRHPHLLVMTATPIPRTLALTTYGDLDLSVIDSGPVNRGAVKTFVRRVDALPKIWKFVRQQLEAGRQAYVVCPRIEDEESGPTVVRAVTRELVEARQALAPHRAEMLHGRMRAEERDATMAAFREGRIAVLVATTVIEVGVDVPNATVMVIRSAERYGLSQLHQLRGRIGRGGGEAWCILVDEATSEEATDRLQKLAATSDGFAVAELDLLTRGSGDLVGTEQTGTPKLLFGDLRKDRRLMEAARKVAQASG